MNRTFYFGVVAALLLPFVNGCSTLSEGGNTAETASSSDLILKAVQSVKDKHAPDSKMAIFDVSTKVEGHHLTLKGEVDRSEAKQDLLDAIRKIGYKPVDRITVLPAESLGDKVWGIVRISVANVRDNPGHSAELGNQVMMGYPIKIWKEQGSWCLVQSSDHYVGWMEEGSFVPSTKEELNAWNNSERLIVTNFTDRIRQEPSRNAPPLSDIVAGALVKKLGEESGWHKIQLPDGRVGYIPMESAMPYETWRQTRQPSGDNIEKAALDMLGLPYLWGGTSTKGVDCSGFTKLVYYFNGINLLRNASHQSRQGTAIPLDPQLSQLRKGDLLFFGSKGSKDRPPRVSHVGIYLGDKKFIHSANMVRINSLDPKSALLDERRLRGLVSARRYLPE